VEEERSLQCLEGTLCWIQGSAHFSCLALFELLTLISGKLTRLQGRAVVGSRRRARRGGECPRVHLTMAGPVVLITGCTEGGIGHALCCYLHGRGCRVFATARRPEAAAGLEERGIPVLKLDVQRPESCQQAVEDVIEAAGRLDILVNNAGGNLERPLLCKQGPAGPRPAGTPWLARKRRQQGRGAAPLTSSRRAF
jgi:hypothetical protein